MSPNPQGYSPATPVATLDFCQHGIPAGENMPACPQCQGQPLVSPDLFTAAERAARLAVLEPERDASLGTAATRPAPLDLWPWQYKGDTIVRDGQRYIWRYYAAAQGYYPEPDPGLIGAAGGAA